MCVWVYKTYESVCICEYVSIWLGEVKYMSISVRLWVRMYACIYIYI